MIGARRIDGFLMSKKHCGCVFTLNSWTHMFFKHSCVTMPNYEQSVCHPLNTLCGVKTFAASMFECSSYILSQQWVGPVSNWRLETRQFRNSLMWLRLKIEPPKWAPRGLLKKIKFAVPKWHPNFESPKKMCKGGKGHTLMSVSN